MKDRILVLGYFSYLNNEPCGQSIKTRNIYNLLRDKSEYFRDVRSFDTEQFQQSKFLIFKMIREIWNCDKLIYVPAQNNLYYLFPLIYLIAKIRHIDIFYFVVGGWLADFLQHKKLHIYLLSHIRMIMPETNELSIKLKAGFNFDNVSIFPNFRIHNFTPSFSSDQKQFRIVFMARITRMKGLDTIFMLADQLESFKLKKRPVHIDFYGLINGDEEYFRNNIAKYNFVSYKGILEPDKIYPVLSNYDLMVLPTRYYTEGFPGSVLDAYISGIPVIVTNWNYATEFVKDGETGYIVPFENGEKDFIDDVIKIYNDNELLTKMKQKAYEHSKYYSSSSAWEILKK